MRIPDGELRVWLSEWLKFVEITGVSDSLWGGVYLISRNDNKTTRSETTLSSASHDSNKMKTEEVQQDKEVEVSNSTLQAETKESEDETGIENHRIMPVDYSYTDELYKVWKRVGVIGDSLSVGYSRNSLTNETLRRNLSYSWVKCVSRDSGVPWLNFGTSGQNVLTWCSDNTYGKAQMEAENNKCQLYVVCLGVNDLKDVPLGKADDIVDDPDTVASTYFSGYARIIQLIKRRNSDAVIFCTTIPNENKKNRPLNDAVRYIAGTKYTVDDNVFLLDFAVEYKSLFTSVGEPLQFDSSSVSHYSTMGYQMISKIMEDAISKTMLKYHDRLLNIGFIPYDTGTPTANTMID